MSGQGHADENPSVEFRGGDTLEDLWIGDQPVGRLLSGQDARAKQAERRVDELEQRVDQLRYAVDQLVTDLPTQKRTKRQKMAAIIRRVAKDARTGAERGAISRPKAAGAADCSERHALNLFSDLGDSFRWAKYDPEGKPHARLLVHFGEDGPTEFLNDVSDEFPEVADE